MDATLYCPACGYNLTGLPEHRCPECGEAFSPADLRLKILLRSQLSRRAVLFFFWAVPAGFWILSVLCCLLAIGQSRMAEDVFGVGTLLLIGLAVGNVIWLGRKSFEADQGRPSGSKTAGFAVLLIMGLVWQASAALAGTVLILSLGALTWWILF